MITAGGRCRCRIGIAKETRTNNGIVERSLLNGIGNGSGLESGWLHNEVVMGGDTQ